MKTYVIEVSDELADSIERVARTEDRTPEAYIARKMKLVLFGHISQFPPMTDEERETLREQMGLRKRTPRQLLSAKDRNKIFERDGGKCRHCDGTILYDEIWHIDHLKPVAKGGTNDPKNLALSCARCNLKKGAKG